MKKIRFEFTDKFRGTFDIFDQLFKDDITEDEIENFGNTYFNEFLADEIEEEMKTGDCSDEVLKEIRSSSFWSYDDENIEDV